MLLQIQIVKNKAFMQQTDRSNEYIVICSSRYYRRFNTATDKSFVEINSTLDAVLIQTEYLQRVPKFIAYHIPFVEFCRKGLV